MDEKEKIMNGKIYKPVIIKNNVINPGDSLELPDESFFSGETLIFIDANFLSKLSKHFGKGKYLIYDLIKFSDYLARKQKLNCKDIYYYTAPPFQSDKPTEKEEKKRWGYDRFLNKLNKGARSRIIILALSLMLIVGAIVISALTTEEALQNELNLLEMNLSESGWLINYLGLVSKIQIYTENNNILLAVFNNIIKNGEMKYEKKRI